jgi:hypothetical protein
VQVKLSFVGYTVCGIGLSMFLGYLAAASPASRFILWIIGMVCLCCLALGFLNFGGLVAKGYGFNRKTFTIGLMPGLVFAFVFLMLVAAGVSLGVR